MTAESPVKVLVVRVGRVGDLVMITPALNRILDGPDAPEVHLLTSEDGPRGLNGVHPRLTEFHPYNRRFPKNLISPRKLLETLRDLKFKRVYVFETNPHYHRLVDGLAPDQYNLPDASEVVHYSVRCLDLVEESLPSGGDHPWISLPVSSEGRERANIYFADHGIGPEEWLVGIHPTTSDSRKNILMRQKGWHHRIWQNESYARLAEILRDYGKEQGFSIRPVMDLLPEESGVGDHFAQNAQDSLTILTGPPDFERYKAVIERMKLLITPNTGPMHIAAAVGTPLVALFSGWSPEDCGPFVPEERFRLIRAEESEDPNQALNGISPEKVFETARIFLPGS